MWSHDLTAEGIPRMLMQNKLMFLLLGFMIVAITYRHLLFPRVNKTCNFIDEELSEMLSSFFRLLEVCHQNWLLLWSVMRRQSRFFQQTALSYMAKALKHHGYSFQALWKGHCKYRYLLIDFEFLTTVLKMLKGFFVEIYSWFQWFGI